MSQLLNASPMVNTSEPHPREAGKSLLFDHSGHGEMGAYLTVWTVARLLHTTMVDPHQRQETFATSQVATPSWLSNAFMRSPSISPNSTDEGAQTRAQYEDRIAQLRSYGIEDGVSVNDASERHFYRFVDGGPQLRRGSVVLLDNGNLRAVWRVGNQEVGVQFFGDGSVHYMIAQEGYGGKITRTADTTDVEGLLEAVETAGLGHLVHG